MMRARQPMRALEVIHEVERASLKLESVAVCLHFLEPVSVEPSRKHGCPVFQSMEMDLLSYMYQNPLPFMSRCVSQKPFLLDVVFPAIVEYKSEGRKVILRLGEGDRGVRQVAAQLSETTFAASGRRVWHLALSPVDGGSFTEFDVIKLVHLYDGRSEGTDLGTKVAFRIDNGTPLRIDKLLPTLISKTTTGAKPGTNPVPNPTPLQAIAGTIEVILPELPGGLRLDKVISVMNDTEGKGADDAEDALELWLKTDAWQGIKACCGIVGGIFDFDKMDREEMVDTLDATFRSDSSMIRVHRCTLTCLAEEDRALNEVKGYVGISPYLIIPHAVLLHNESLIREAERGMENALRGRGRRIGDLAELESTRVLAEKNLNRYYLPNVFNYRTERALYAIGFEQRGSNARLDSTRHLLEELAVVIEQLWERRRSWSQLLIEALLLFLTLISLSEALEKVAAPYGMVVDWKVFGEFSLAVIAIFVLAWLYRFRGLKK